MRSHIFQHVPFEGPGSIEPWLRAAGHNITRTPFFIGGSTLPAISDIDSLIVMGGPMSANDEQLFPWLAQEKAFIRRAIDDGKPVLGICLGAQLIASAMGARVYPNPTREIGWFPIHGCTVPGANNFSFPSSVNVFHWHGETFDLPSGAIHLASSDVCRLQAFQLGTSVIGLQFHLETTPASARDIVTHCSAELTPDDHVQDAATLLSASPECYRTINHLMGEILAYLLASNSCKT
ncbi:type 1 glutamine amidotransferase [Porticoccus hydrocarbonoclasticus]|jgi:GMP synthase-like glutamine amidotransferase|uniref:type 1 glutamine amidotransferase n=1 Tax=Porticoccus hydrocarbonoclasticus TaxID=1073414 RepID=UPI00055F2689|nr:gamma-glutamyl-gamma-aminobutyrate hydrolase family protein [Porticoccus hydrocarbonoclasticus]|tara:strand:+ start:454 stop:1161 length:708 start_codon:yes stop_codon:yes gene_type:complete